MTLFIILIIFLLLLACFSGLNYIGFFDNKTYAQVQRPMTDKMNVFDEFDRARLAKPKKAASEVIRDFCVETVVDDFTDISTTRIQTIVDGKQYLPAYFGESEYYVDHLGFSFSLSDKYIFLEIYSYLKEMTLAKGDELILIFNDKHRLNFNFMFPSRGSGLNCIVLTLEDLKVFATKKMEKWRLHSGRKNTYIVGDNSEFAQSSSIKNKDDWQTVFNGMAVVIGREYFKQQGYINDDFTFINDNLIE